MRTVTSESASAEQQGTEELPERVREALGETRRRKPRRA